MRFMSPAHTSNNSHRTLHEKYPTLAFALPMQNTPNSVGVGLRRAVGGNMPNIMTLTTWHLMGHPIKQPLDEYLALYAAGASGPTTSEEESKAFPNLSHGQPHRLAHHLSISTLEAAHDPRELRT